jgi:hypothetical protein
MLCLDVCSMFVILPFGFVLSCSSNLSCHGSTRLFHKKVEVSEGTLAMLPMFQQQQICRRCSSVPLSSCVSVYSYPMLASDKPSSRLQMKIGYNLHHRDQGTLQSVLSGFSPQIRAGHSGIGDTMLKNDHERLGRDPNCSAYFTAIVKEYFDAILPVGL